MWGEGLTSEEPEQPGPSAEARPPCMGVGTRAATTHPKGERPKSKRGDEARSTLRAQRANFVFVGCSITRGGWIARGRSKARSGGCRVCTTDVQNAKR